ncbi:NADAR family protein [Skermania piniformis]|uniref:NADAR family protein n=1 Tax=Skermania pinensis TaxID=39122 RepID=A0ABX8SEA4_9ACTN|nr:NADAR family protein [Skermania piniformis]
MLEILRSKVANPDAARLLRATGTAELVEGNRRHDNHWGHCTCRPCRRKGTQGLNTLGKLLMQIRDGLR